MNTIETLPALSGSEKQVAWAEQIRAAFFKAPYSIDAVGEVLHGPALVDYANYAQQSAETTRRIAEDTPLAEDIERARELLYSETSASFWIEIRKFFEFMDVILAKRVKAIREG